MDNHIPIDDIVKQLLQHNLLVRLEIAWETSVMRIVGCAVRRAVLPRKCEILAEREREKLL